jgi:hypothetical protein
VHIDLLDIVNNYAPLFRAIKRQEGILGHNLLRDDPLIGGARDSNPGMSDLDKAIAQLRSCRPIPETQVRELCYKARELLIEEGNVVTVNAPVTVCRPFSPLLLTRPMLMRARYAATFTASSTT